MSGKDRISRLVVRAQRWLPRRILNRRYGAPPTIDGFTLDHHVHAYQAVVTAGQARRAPDVITVDVIRNGFRRMAALGSGSPVAAVSVHDRTIPGPAGDLAIRLYHPKQTTGKADAIVWFHQGGGVIGDLDTDHTLCTLLADTAGALVISVDYRLAPEHPFPADSVDATAAYQWVVDQANGLGIDPHRVAVAGSSQGGKLAAVVCQQRRRDGLRPPLAQILLYSSLDAGWEGGSRDSMAEAWPLGESTMAFFGANAEVDESRTTDLAASPGREANLAGLPPALVVTAGFDPLRDQGNDFAERLMAAGVRVVHRCETSLPHSFTLMGAVSKAADRATRQVADDVAELLATI